jgi:ferredoxin/flavodoxin---NADP+ reductase
VNLWLIATGTGLAPFLSIIKDPETYERFERVIVVHTCRYAEDLAYRRFIEHELPASEPFGELIGPRLTYYPTVTREPFHYDGRFTERLLRGHVYNDLSMNAIAPQRDRFMLCGNPDMLTDTTGLLDSLGFIEGNSGEPGDYLVEKAFAVK